MVSAYLHFFLYGRAAYTVMMMNTGGSAPPEEEVDFVLDRPFLFAITGYDGLPLFVGVVNRPAA